MHRSARHPEAGSATAELAACLPVLVLVLAVAISAVGAAAARVRLQDAAREAARAAARGDPATAQRLVQQVAPGARLDLSTGAGEIVAVLHAKVHPLAGFLPAMSLEERAVAAVEPTGASP